MNNEKNPVIPCLFFLPFSCQQILYYLLLYLIIFLPGSKAGKLSNKQHFSLKSDHVVLPNGEYYYGPLNKKGLPEGYGRTVSGNYASYTGDFSGGYMHGKGTIQYTAGDKFEGEFLYGRAVGQGVYTGTDGRQISGIFNTSDYPSKLNLLSKKQQDEGGLVADPALTRYGVAKVASVSGYFTCIKSTGTGTMVWPDGRAYSGGIMHGQMHGKGVLNWPNGFTYEGDFLNDHIEGNGELFYRYTTETPNITVLRGKWERGYFIFAQEGIPDKYKSVTNGILLREPFMLTVDKTPQYAEWQYIKERAEHDPCAENPVTKKKLLYAQVKKQGIDRHYQQEIEQWLQCNAVYILDVVDSNIMISDQPLVYTVTATYTKGSGEPTRTYNTVTQHSLLIQNARTGDYIAAQYID